jgi:hypothetical protein
MFLPGNQALIGTIQIIPVFFKSCEIPAENNTSIADNFAGHVLSFS